ncbi:MAG: YceI family protein [Desulfamplus sp.]|nr:YceI family protein [Desulfamplus sp.]MBF0388973.1 YceI family protein [Desulfamplus sp.]
MSLVSTYCLTPNSGNLFVYTFKEGMLSTLSHDLLIKVTDFKINLNMPNGDLSSGNFNLEVKPDSLKVSCAMKEGKRELGLLKNRDKSEIKSFIEEDVLHISKYPTIIFKSMDIKKEQTYYLVKGELSLHGTNRCITFKVKSDDGKRFKGSVMLLQTHYGIKPYNALMGGLRVRDRIKVGFDLAIE